MHVYCTAITMQCFSYAIRSQSVLTTIQLGVSTVFSTAHTYHERDSFHIACLHDFSGPALLSCSKILTYQLLGSQLWTAFRGGSRIEKGGFLLKRARLRAREIFENHAHFRSKFVYFVFYLVILASLARCECGTTPSYDFVN